MSLFLSNENKNKKKSSWVVHVTYFTVTWRPFIFLDCRKCEAMQTKAPTEGVYHGYRWAHRCQVCVWWS